MLGLKGTLRALAIRGIFVVGVVASVATDTTGPGITATASMDIDVEDYPATVDVVVQYSADNASRVRLVAYALTEYEAQAGNLTMIFHGAEFPEGAPGGNVSSVAEAVGDDAQASARVDLDACSADECLVVASITLSTDTPPAPTHLVVEAHILPLDAHVDAERPRVRVDLQLRDVPR